MGEIDQAKKSLYNYHQVWKQYGFVPEFYDISTGKHHKREGYPLRPEFIESVLFLYQATKDPHLLMIGADVVDSIYHSARTECGYATIKSVSDHTIEDRMESFFLAETLKYLYLLFDEDNFMHNKGTTGTIIEHMHEGRKETCVTESGGWFFNTEAHPIDAAALTCCHRKHSNQDYYFDNDEAEFENFKANLNLFDLVKMKKVSELEQSCCGDQANFEVEDEEDAEIPVEQDQQPKDGESFIIIGPGNVVNTSNFVMPEDVKAKETLSTSHDEASISAHSVESEPTEPEDNIPEQSPQDTSTLKRLANIPRTIFSELNDMARNILAPDDQEDHFYDQEEEGEADTCVGANCDANPEDDSSISSSDSILAPPKYELLHCRSQSYLSRLSLYGQMFE